MKVGDKIKKGDVIGHIHSYIDSGKDYPHLHWGAWLGKNIHNGLLGYDKQFNMFVDPDSYMNYACPGWFKPTVDYKGYRQFAFPLTEKSFHLGDDRKTKLLDPCFACLDGEVVSIQYLNGFGGNNPKSKGWAIWIRHKNRWGHDFYILYGHVEPKKEGE